MLLPSHFILGFFSRTAIYLETKSQLQIAGVQIDTLMILHVSEGTAIVQQNEQNNSVAVGLLPGAFCQSDDNIGRHRRRRRQVD